MITAQVDHNCDRFEAAWKRGQAPALEDYLVDCPDGQKPHLLRELLLLDLDYRRRGGCLLERDEYERRFPDFVAVVRSTLQLSDALAGRLADPEASADEAPEPLPRSFGNYCLLQRLGQGGMGIVYRARHEPTGRIVALKCIRPDKLSGSPDVRRQMLNRFQREVRSLARIEHENVVTVYDVGECEGQPYFSMQLVNGHNLRVLIEQGPLPNRVAAELMEQVGRALQAAHENGVLHRDIKPHNILVDHRSGRAMLTDFGLAKLVREGLGETATTAPFGTPSYMSPEQLAARGEVNAATDVYGLGATLYHLLTGHPPFQATSLLETLLLIELQVPVAPRRFRSGISRDLQTICLKCLAKRPADRFRSAGDVADELRRYLNGRPIRTRPPGPLKTAWQWSRRRPLAVGLLGLAAALSLVTAGLLHYKSRFESARRTAEMQHYVSHVYQVRERISLRPPGWTWDALDALRGASHIDTPVRQDSELRSLAATCLSELDVRPRAVIPHGFRPEAATFLDDGTLAVAACKSFPSCPIVVYDCETREPLQEFRIFNGLQDVLQLAIGNERFQEGFRSLEYHSGQRLLAAGTRHGWIYVWNQADAEQPPFRWKAHDGAVQDLAFSADGRSLVTLSRDAAQAAVWYFDDGWHERRKLPLAGRGRISRAAQGGRILYWPTERGMCLLSGGELQDERYFPGLVDGQVTPDGQFLVARNGADSTYRLVELATGRQRPILRKLQFETPFDGPPRFGPDRRLLALRSEVDQDLLLCDYLSEQVVGRIATPGRRACPFRLSPDGRLLAVLGPRETTLYEVRASDATGSLGATLDPLQAFDVSPDGRLVVGLAEAEEDVSSSVLTAWNTETGHPLRQFRAACSDSPQRRFSARQFQRSVCFDPQQPSVACASAMLGTFRLDLADAAGGGSTLPVFAQRPHGSSAVLVQESAVLNVAGTSSSPEEDPQASDGRCLRLRGDRDARLELAVPDGFRGPCCVYASVQYEGTDANRPAELDYQLRLVAWGDAQAVCGRGVSLPSAAANGSLDVRLDYLLFLPAEVRPTTFWLGGHGPLRFSPDGRDVWGILGEMELASWDAGDMTLRQHHSNWWELLRGDVANLYCLDVGPAGLVAGTRSGHLLAADLQDIQEQRELAGPGGSVRAVAWSPDQKRVAMGTDSGRVRLIEWPSERIVADLNAHVLPVTALAFSPDGRWLVTGSRDRNVRIWRGDTSRWQEWLSLRSLPAGVRCLRFDSRGHRLFLVLEGERSVRFWNLRQLDQAMVPYVIPPRRRGIMGS